MTITEQIAEIKAKYPEAWAHIQEMLDNKKMEGEREAFSPAIPKFDDNDEWIKGGTDND
jgi:hypothetical protein